MVHKYRIQKIRRDNITDAARDARRAKILKRAAHSLAYTQKMITGKSTEYLHGLTGFIKYTYQNRIQKESLLLKIVTWFRIWKFFVFNKQSYKFN